MDGAADNSWFGDGQKWAASKNDYSNDTCINAKEGGTIKLSYKLPKMANYTMASWPSSDSITLAQATSVTSCKGGSWSHSWDTGTTVNDVTTYTCLNCDDIERQTVESECTHSYTSGSTAQWTWADLSSATVTLTCDQCGETQTYDATVASSVEGDATTYTATYTYGEDVVFTNTKTVNTSADHTHTDSPVVAKSISGATVSAIAKRTYSGKAFTPSPTVKYGTTTLVKGTDYTLSYVNNIKAGTATVIIKGKGAYTGTKRITFKIVKAANSLKFKKTVKTLRASALKTAKKVVRPLVVKRANGTVTYTRVSGSKYLKIAKKTGKVTVAKGTPKGIYKIRVKVRALGNSCYKAKTKTVLLKVRVK